MNYKKLYKNWIVHTFVGKPFYYLTFMAVKTMADERSATKLNKKIRDTTNPETLYD